MAVQYKLNTGQYNKYTGKYIQGTRLLKSSAVQNLKKKSLKLNKYSSYKSDNKSLKRRAKSNQMIVN